MKNKLIIRFALFLCGFCFGQKYDPIKFDTVKRNSSAKDLFLKRIIAKDPNTYEDKTKIYSAIEAFEKFKQTRNATQFDLKIENNKKAKIIGKFYGIERYTETDTVFKYDNLLFNRFYIYSDLKDKTVGYRLFNDHQNVAILNKFLEECYSKTKDSSKNSKEIKKEYFFVMDDRIVILKRYDSNLTSISESMEPMSMEIGESNSIKQTELKKNDSEPPVSIELMVVLNNLTIDLKKYFGELIYNR